MKTLSVGTQVNSGQTKYTVEKILGQGGFGITYQVSATIKYGKIEQKARFAMKEHFLSDYCERDSTTSSVKFSAPVKEKVDESLRDFTAEARRLNSLDHPNIVAVNEVFEANDTAYYVMEYIEGKSLREFVKSNGTLSEKEALTIISPIINAVSYLHENHMTHLDIKPDNIMLKPTDNGGFTPILIDFGLSKHYDEKGKPTSTIRIQGCSNGYAPVEQYLGINSFSPTADVYALAATLYYLVVGKDPIIASELNQEVLTSSLPSSLSERTRNAIYNAMRMAKANRTQSVADFSRELGITLDRNSAPSVTPERPSCTQQIEKPQPQKDNNSTEIIFNETKHSSKKWLIPVIITLSLIIACALWWGSGFFGNESWWGEDSTSIVASSSNETLQPTDSTTHYPESISTITELPEDILVAAEPVSGIDDGYSTIYAELLSMYNSGRYAECKNRCQNLLRQYSKSEQLRQLNQLIDYCDSAIEREQATELERQYKSDYSSAEGLYNQKKYNECISKCNSMLKRFPSHSNEINELISICRTKINESSPTRLPDKAVDLGLSVYWCDRNVGAGNSSGSGLYYTFHEASSAARNMGGGDWRLPTYAELEELDSKCTWSWTGSGYRVTGPNGNSIYLPAAGWHNGTSANYVGRYGHYWSSSPLDSNNAYYLYLNATDGHYSSYNSPDKRFSVRPVCSK